MCRSQFLSRVKLLGVFGLSLFFGGCSVEKAELQVDSCQSSIEMAEIDKLNVTRPVAAGSAIGQHFVVGSYLTLRTVTFQASASGLTNFILTFYEDFKSADQIPFSQPIAVFNMAQNFSSGTVAPLAITLPTPVQIKPGIEYLVSFAPNTTVSLLSGDIGASNLRGYYRNGNATPTLNWADATQGKALSITLAGDLDCADR
jgi:hypothetical protein